jgi:hypothetical protein
MILQTILGTTIIGLMLSVNPLQAESPVVEEPIKTPCEQYKDIIRSYDWNDDVAIKIMLAESSCNPKIINDNPATKDYSIGLFQINIYGGNAKHRPSEEELKDPHTNIEFAYNLYKDYGFQSQWGVCRKKVNCI